MELSDRPYILPRGQLSYIYKLFGSISTKATTFLKLLEPFHIIYISDDWAVPSGWFVRTNQGPIW